jgi:FtsZ-binding cell division protein ZapB
MSKFLGEGEDVEEAQAEQRSFEETADSRTLTVSADDFSALEERVLRAVELVKRERLARAAAEQRASAAELQLHEQAPQVEHLQKEVNALRSERDYVRQRVERLLGQLDALEL